MSTEDRNGHLHGRGGKYTEKPATAPGATATLAQPEPKHSYDDPRPGRTYCASVTSIDCLAPAGYGNSRGTASVPGVRKADLYECAYCCEPVCQKCAVVFGDRYACALHDPEQVRAWLGLNETPVDAVSDAESTDGPADKSALDRVRAVLDEWGLVLEGAGGITEDEDFAEAIRDNGAWRLARDLRAALTPPAPSLDGAS